MKELKKIIETLESMICAKVCEGTEGIDTHEFYEVADIFKDFVESYYKLVIIEAMENPENEYGKDWNENGRMKRYTEPRMHYQMDVDDYRNKTPEEMRRIDHENGRMYYTDTGSTNANDGTSGMARRTYMEHKDKGDTNMNMHNIEDYFNKLRNDINGMTVGMNQNEKNLSKQKLQMIMQGIA